MDNDISSHFRKKVKELKKDKKFEEALKYSDIASQIEREEKVDDFWYKRAIRFCEIGEYDEAIKCLDNDLEKRKKNFDSFFIKGKILLQLKKYAESVECFKKASENINVNYLQNSKKVKHLKKAHKYEKALTYSDKAKNEKHLDDDYWYYKGLALFKLKKIDESNSCFKKALEKNYQPKFLYEIAKCKLFSQQQKECLDILRQCCRLEPKTREKLRVDNDFLQLTKNKEFRIILGL